jgi:hypothetical protein
LLIARDEIEPWYGASGVVVSAAGALTVLVIGVGSTVLLHTEASLASSTIAIAVPWACAVAATGWLRPSPAVAMVTPAVIQAMWLLLN